MGELNSSNCLALVAIVLFKKKKNRVFAGHHLSTALRMRGRLGPLSRFDPMAGLLQSRVRTARRLYQTEPMTNF